MAQSNPGKDLNAGGDWLVRSRSFASFTVAVCLLICSISVFWGHEQYQSRRERALASDQTTVRLLADIMEGHQKAVIGILESCAGSPLFSAAVKQKDQDDLIRHLSALKKNHEIDLTFVTDEKGILWANFPVFPEAMGSDLSHRDWYRGVSAHWSPYISRVFRLIVGDRPLASAIAVPVFDEQGKVVGVLASSQRLSFLNDLVERVSLDPHMTLSVVDGEGRIILSTRISGYVEEIIPYPLYAIVQQARRENLRQVQATGADEHQEKIYMAIAPLGTVGWTVVAERTRQDILNSQLRSWLETGAVNLFLCLAVVFLLLYFRKTALLKRTAAVLSIETALRESDEKFRLAFENANTGMCLVDLEGRLVQVNDKMSAIFGYPKGELEGMSVNDLALPEDADLSTDFIHRAIEGGGDSATFEIRYRHRQGHIIYGLIASSLVRDAQGKPRYFISQVRDITERKRAEEALLESEQKFKVMAETSPLAIYASSDIRQKANYINPTFVRLFGYTIDDVPTAAEWWPLACPDETYRSQVVTEWQRRVEHAIEMQTSIEPMEVVVVCKDGSKRDIVWGYVSTPAQNFAFGLDLTERKRAEQALLESEERFRLFMDNSPVIAWVKDEQGRHVYLSRTYEKRFGVRLDEWRGKTDSELWPPEIAEEFRRNDLTVLGANCPTEVIEKTINPDGSSCYWLNTRFPFVDAAGNRFVAGMGLDITERKRSEEALRVSEERLHLALDAAKAGTWEWDLRTSENFWSEELFRLYGLEPHSCEPSYEAWFRTIHPEDREKMRQTVQEAAGAGMELRAEWRVHSQQGEERWLMSQGRPVFDDQGTAVRYVGIVIDMTERKRAELELYHSHQEKVTLLKEVHHRVKNNLQIVISLLGLQAGRINNPEALDILGDTRNRVYSMALLHETLYRAESFASIRFNSYIDKLTGHIARSYGQYSPRVKVEHRVIETGLPLEQAVPCGLIINELVSNALKHAFPDNRPGLITVALERSDDHMLILRVRDNGVGLPQGLDLAKSSTLGLSLVHQLARQLLGSVKVDSPAEGGTELRVVFPAAPKASFKE